MKSRDMKVKMKGGIRKTGWLVCFVLEYLCSLTHPIQCIEIKLTGRHCNLARLSYWIEQKLCGYWKEEK